MFEMTIAENPEHFGYFDEVLNTIGMGVIDWFAPRLDIEELEDTFALIGYEEIKGEMARLPKQDIPEFVATAHLFEGGAGRSGFIAGAVHHAANDLGLSICPDWQPPVFRPGQVCPRGTKIIQKFGPGNQVRYIQAVGPRLRVCVWSSHNGRPRHTHFRDFL